jgi:rfaE bifunctional protein nucleotidyltransferase chain/domain
VKSMASLQNSPEFMRRVERDFRQEFGGSSIVLAHGTFDLLHIGHIRHLEEARRQGDRLVVSVTADRYVCKGAGRPRFTVAERVEALKALACVDEVVISEAPDAVDVIERLKPAVFVKGLDYASKEQSDQRLVREAEVVRSYGGRLHITKTELRSSSRLLNGEKFSPEVVEYLDQARRNGFGERINEALVKADQLKVAFVGETIIDEYRYVQGLGRSSKEFMLATVETGSECFHGGVAAAAKHGEWPNAHVVSPAKTLRKTRFVDADFNRKLFDVYSARRIDVSDQSRAAFRSELRKAVQESDIVIVNDFGHGLIGDVERGMMETAKFLAVNAQTNAGNFGFNLVTNYLGAEYVCIDDPEARLAAGMADAPIESVIRDLSGKVQCRRFIVTHGRYGSAFLDAHGFGTAPAFTASGIDTMGAGDAVMAVTAPLVAAGLDLAAAALVGNVVGALKVGIIGHRRHVGRTEWKSTVEALLK